jgi:hypothetical protein
MKIKDKTWFIIIIVFLGGFGIGMYVTLLSQKQLAVVGASAYIVAVFGGLGTVSVIFSKVQEWQKK